ncbi:hypothetical protein [Rubinisphaera italica]|uniref:Uncharacterized protein n=1 Tax=Rubinisphaera italica TaxID=2527969 RepID=A0A5C5X8Y1_9PLAN|nr:hypothetical protein [Rubinisphaera italica]TWT59324.1 hypothetical protein Pan54_00240 [Rubinisphaera italica]
MRNKITQILNLLTFIFLIGIVPSTAWAHPGHGQPETQSTIWHYLSEPMHIAPALGVIAMAIWMVVRFFATNSDKNQH